MLDRVQHTIRGASFRTSITTLGGNIVATETNLPPLAAFDVKFFQESEDTGSGVESRIIVVADGSASTDLDGDTLTYAWALAVDAGTITPSTGAGVSCTAVISGAATSVTITLTVTDADAATDVLGPQTYPLRAGTMTIEPLYVAWDGELEASVDGEKTWNSFSVAAGPTCTPPFANGMGTIWGASDGTIWITNDDLATDPIDTGAPAARRPVRRPGCTSWRPARAWAAYEDGKVYAGVVDSAAPAVVWTLAGTLPEGPVTSIRESVGTLGSLRATAGAGYYASEDSGATWSLLHTFDVAWGMAAGFERNLAIGLNSTPPIFGEEGTAPTVPAA